MVAEPGPDVRIWPLTCGLSVSSSVTRCRGQQRHVRLAPAESGPVRLSVPNTCQSFSFTPGLSGHDEIAPASPRPTLAWTPSPPRRSGQIPLGIGGMRARSEPICPDPGCEDRCLTLAHADERKLPQKADLRRRATTNVGALPLLEGVADRLCHDLAVPHQVRIDAISHPDGGVIVGPLKEARFFPRRPRRCIRTPLAPAAPRSSIWRDCCLTPS